MFFGRKHYFYEKTQTMQAKLAYRNVEDCSRPVSSSHAEGTVEYDLPKASLHTATTP